MIIYIADRDLQIKATASTTLYGGYRVYEDVTTEDIETGVSTFSCKIGVTDTTRDELEEAVKVGRFLLKQSGRAFMDSENTYDSLYHIIETEYDTKDQSLSIYAEDAGLDLIGKMVDASTQTSKTLAQMLSSVKPDDWTLNLMGCPTGTKTYKWDGESTATERMRSIADLFKCELFYSFVIERFKITEKVINVTPKRGNQTPVARLRLNRDIDRIVTKTSIAGLVTALRVKGGTPEKSDNPITLKGYSYSYTDPVTGDVYEVQSSTGRMRNLTAMKRWASVIDTDGYILKTFTYDTTSKSTLAGQARAELQKLSQPVVNYEVDFASLPEYIQIGDKVNIIDEGGELYLEARILKLETSASDGTHKATVGEFLLKESGITESISELASQFSNMAKQMLYQIEITSSGGEVFIDTVVDTTLTAHVYLNGIELTDDEVAEVGTIKWYQGENLLAEGKTYTITAEQELERIEIIARLEKD